MVEFKTVRVELVLIIPPPPPLVALLFEMVELETEMVPPLKLLIPPPYAEAKFPEIVESEIVSAVPWLKMPPPAIAELPEIVEVEIARTPALLKAPPKPEVFAPDTVTPEIERLPKLTIEKTLKLPLLALMLRVFAPGPVMVRVPAVATSAMAGSTPVRDIVAGPLVNSEEAKTIVSAPAVTLAKSIASLKEVKASVADVSCRVFTVIGVGLILSSR